ncbi:MAG: NAD(P)H-dependent oxidoreductase [Caulobacteraceae bacterium]
MSSFRPHIVGLGGTSRPQSSTEHAVRAALAAAERLGAETSFLGGEDLDFPMYAPHRPDRSEAAARMVQVLAGAHGVILASPGYHGGVSGLMKNALDHIEELRTAEEPYLEGRAVGCIVTAGGWQAGGGTLTALRSIVHALRGWPTPLGVIINTSEPAFGADGACLQSRVQSHIETMAAQVVAFARQRQAWEAAGRD